MSTAALPASRRRSRCLPACCMYSPWHGSEQSVRPSYSVSARRLETTAQASLWLSVLVVTVLFGWGGGQRRWVADDGLIVLRTVRNLLAGNGPVFNMGERVEVNTSTLWTYLVYLGGVVGGPPRGVEGALGPSAATDPRRR